MIDIIKYGDFKPLGKQKKKHQIILTHTGRNVENYLASLRYRYNGKFDRIPNYVIKKDGVILQLLNNIEHTNYFKEPNINRNGIIICLENLGWLEKQPLENQYVNWIGDIYNGKPFERRWRDYFFWDKYTEEQINSLALLCNRITKEKRMSKDIIGHNTKVRNVDMFEGIVTKSNFDSNITDLSPAFDFEKFRKKLENEQ
jgi:N-acetyl-anhydromuramyl-L-alanine amidase AmpD